MPTFVAFLRAVNVSPRWVKMEALRNLLSDNDFRAVETHIQSGNVLLTTSVRSAAKVRDQLCDLLSTEFGFEIPVVVRTPKQLVALVDDVAKLPSPLSDEARIYVALADGKVDAQGRKVLESWDRPGERAKVLGHDVVLWLEVPAHAAKLTNARIEKAAGTAVTTRDIKVLRALAEKWCS